MPDPADMLTALQQEAHVRIDLDRYATNINILRQFAGSDAELMAVVKADAYGHGAVECGRVALRSGATYLAVARIWEAVNLRCAGIEAPILVFGGPNLATLELAIANDLTVSVGSESALDACIHTVERLQESMRVHLKVDTGLHRYGFLPDLAEAAARRLHDHPLIGMEGLYAHFSSADEQGSQATIAQIERAHRLLDTLAASGIDFKYIHLPNSAATITGMCGRSNLFREGIASYGLAPSDDVPLPEGILPVMSVHACITRVFELPEGEGVSYGLTYQSQHNEIAATVPIGYADGLPRSLSNAGWFALNGETFPVLGRVCMDQTIIRASGNLAEYMQIEIAGDGGQGEMSLDDIARMSGTINYEVATRMASRMPRVYIENGKAVRFDIPARS